MVLKLWTAAPLALAIGLASGPACAKGAKGAKQISGVAAYYSQNYRGRTASGARYDPNKFTAAHRTLPFGTRLRVTNLSNGHSVTVRINDRGPFVRGRDVDVSYSAAQTLGITEQGVAKVKLEVVR